MVEIGIIALTAGAFYKIKKMIDRNIEQNKEKKYTKIKNETLRDIYLEVEEKKEKGKIKEKDVPLMINKRMTEEMAKRPEVFGKEIEEYIQKNMDKYRDHLLKEKEFEEKRNIAHYQKEPNYSYAKEFMKMEEKMREREKAIENYMDKT